MANASQSASQLFAEIDSLWSSVSANSTLAVTSVLVASLVAAYLSSAFSREDSDGIRIAGYVPTLTAWTFFSKRHDFLMSKFCSTGEHIFQFRILQHKVVALSGDAGRQVFFNHKNLNAQEGYKIILGGIPRLEEIDVKGSDFDNSDVSWFNKRLATVIHKDRLADLLPTLFEDVDRQMQGWGKEGRLNPFEEFYDLVFQMTVRMATCRELSEDTEAVRRIGELYYSLERSATPAKLLMPWFPSRAKKTSDKATRELYVTLLDYLEKRRAADLPSSDALDVLIAGGDSNEQIIGWVLAVIFAGVLNTRANSCWVLVHLAANPKWKAKVATEINELMAKHTTTASGEKLSQRLSAIPITVWEDEMPVLDGVIREVVRLTITAATMRRNMGEEFRVEGQKIERGTFMTYSLADVHLNPEIYTTPEKFDPTRFDREEDKKAQQAYIGWGTGRHPCTGMKFAKLAIKVIVALFMVGYEYELVDASGRFPQKLPEVDRNHPEPRPKGKPCYLKYKKVVD